jgi:putative ABC transport system permease protein
MVLLVPLVVAGVGGVAARLPLSARYAVRDAARHRSRTAPAVAAVAASVAGVVALGIGASSDAAQNRATYTPTAPIGAAVVSTSKTSPATWAGLERATHRTVPAATVTLVRGVRPETAGGDGVQLDFSGAGSGPGGWTSAYRASVLVADAHSGRLGLRLGPAQSRRADAVLASGGAVVFGQAPAGRRRTAVHLSVYDESTGDVTSRDATTLPAVFLTVAGTVQPVQAVLSPAAAARLHLRVRPAGLLVTGASVDQQREETLREAAAAIAPDSSVYVERGFQDQSTAVVLLILGLAGAVLMVGGTLTATFLALSDARPDLATLAAVGAPPLVRRRVGAAYAGFVGLVGAALGVLVGLVPGIAVTFPLTSTSWESPATRAADGSALPGHFLDVPWLLMVAVVVLLPLLTATVVGLASRSRLPMVARLP